MNKGRRKVLEKAVKSIEDLRLIIEEIKEEESDSFESLPESFQLSEKGETMEGNVDQLEEALSALEDVQVTLDEVINA